MRRILCGLMGLAALVLSAPGSVARDETPESVAGAPIVIGRSYALPSAVMEGPREINVWLPPGYDESDARYPVLYVLDGGQAQDFHHISGLAQLGTVNGLTRDVIVVGVASVNRRDELAFRSDDPEILERWPDHGRSERFRRFLTQEVIPFVEARFRGDGDSALMGESLAGLFVVETFLREPHLFDHYVAISPSLWWGRGSLPHEAPELLAAHGAEARTLLLSIADEGGDMQMAMNALLRALRAGAPEGLAWEFSPRPEESHASIYHGEALNAFRRLYPRGDE